MLGRKFYLFVSVVFVYMTMTFFYFPDRYHINCPGREDIEEMKLIMDDACLISFVIMQKMERPSNLPYHFLTPNSSNANSIINSQFMGIDSFWSDAVFLSEQLIPEDQQTKRFFECGASNGEFLSQTYFAERFLNWSGVLVEADPFYFQQMKGKNRKSVLFNVCASTTNSSSSMPFLHVESGKFNHTTESGAINRYEYILPGNGYIHLDEKIPEIFSTNSTKIIKVFCVPIFTILLAAGMTDFDIFFLDIEGPELEVLQTIPFNKVKISIFVIEHGSVPGKLNKLESFFLEKGYSLQENSSVDALFIKNIYLNRNIDTSLKKYFSRIGEWMSLEPVKEK